MGSRLGGLKAHAARLGIDPTAYLMRLDAGEKWCTGCKAWHSRTEFGKDSTRVDGLASYCLVSLRVAERKPRTISINPVTGRPGPCPKPPRDGDKIQARQRINVEVRTGRRPSPNSLPCTDCGHTYKSGERRHEYDHHLGYAPEHHLDVQPVCTLCHSARGHARGEAIHYRDDAGRFSRGEARD